MNTALSATRKASGKTQKQVAEDSDITERMYQRYESGTEPGVRKAILIAKSMGIEVPDEFCSLWQTQSEPDGNQT